ncbi:hypothetical protein QYE76_038154 [Lolium multiflorum]|uniref:RNase H type-1 domain-containing protein n=1 Tax=Lolium multiflorum TaxID=4521 RepID=A0AAD8T922_LOLMU|nr:hypothetical protein QYE76_038154 [Lolium multiflorum]
MLDALQAMKENAAQAFLTTLYEIWEVRNDAVHEDILNSPVSVARKIHYLIQECENVHQPIAQTCPRPTVRWSKPPRGWIKANSDGALNLEKRIGGCGAILRNHDGNVVVARSSKVDNVMDVETVELLACRQALVLAEELRIPKIMLEMDNVNAYIHTYMELKVGAVAVVGAVVVLLSSRVWLPQFFWMLAGSCPALARVRGCGTTGARCFSLVGAAPKLGYVNPRPLQSSFSSASSPYSFVSRQVSQPAARHLVVCSTQRSGTIKDHAPVSGGTSRGGLQSGGETQSGKEAEVLMQSAVVGVDEVVGDETMMLVTRSWWTET